MNDSAEKIIEYIESLSKPENQKERFKLYFGAGIIDEQGYLSEKIFSKETVEKDRTHKKPLLAPSV
jgi:hypothetical protein